MLAIAVLTAGISGPAAQAPVPVETADRPAADAGPIVAGRASAFDVETLAPGVHLFRPSGRSVTHANSLVVDLPGGLLVVDAQPTPRAASDLLAAIGARSSSPIRYLVFSHPHAVASGGASAFPDSTVRIASRGYRDAVADTEYDFLGELRDLPGIEPSLDWERPVPDLVLFGRTRIEDPRQPVILLPVAHAHSPGDLVVFLPEAGVVTAGDLPFSDSAPYAGAARVSGWISQLNSLMTLGSRRITASRGPAMDVDALRAQRNALVWLQGTVDELLTKDTPEDELTAGVRNADGASRHFAFRSTEDFDRLVTRAIEEARERRRQAGLE
jgi:glyoxylase-like metal-dependent hydrolase (beta-lactamase superfamily II)